MDYTVIVRDRGQLTIPRRVRKSLGWLQEGRAVGLEATDDEVRIRPHAQKEVDWDALWAGIQRCRSFKGAKLDKPLSQFIIEDRGSH